MKQTVILFLFIGLSFSQYGQEVDLAHGEILFKTNCASCHKPDRKLIGPPLKGVSEKYNDIDYLVRFITNSQEVIKSGDERAVVIYEEYNKQIMNPFTQLNQQDIEDILAFVDSFEKEEITGGITIRDLPPKPISAIRPFYLKNNILSWILYFAGVVLLISSLLQLTNVSDLYSRSKEK